MNVEARGPEENKDNSPGITYQTAIRVQMDNSKAVGDGYAQLTFLNENDPVKLLGSNNYLDQLVPIIKTSLKNNSIGELVQKLRNEGSKKDDEIFGLLNQNEDNVELAHKEIRTIIKDASSINEQILDIDDHLSRTSNLTIEKKFQLLELKKNINKINESEILINKVLQVLELTDKTHDLVKANKFFNALKNLNDLNNLSKDFDRDFKFLANINDSIPVLKSMIKEESLGLLRRNFSNTDAQFESFAQEYFDSYSNLIKEWDSFKTKGGDFSKFKINSSVEVSLRSTYSRKGLPEVNELINLGFIYDTLLVFDILDQVPFFKNEFGKEMSSRRERIVYPFVPSDSKNEVFKQYIKDENNLRSFLLKLIGSLIFSIAVSKKFPQIVKQQTNDIWETISAKIYPYLKDHILHDVYNLSKLNVIKELIGHIYLILEHFELSNDHFYNLLILIFKKFSQLSIGNFGKEFHKLAQDDDSMPMAIHEYKLYRKIITIGWYNDPRKENELSFPQILPFSMIYPMACAQMRNFITEQESFLKDYYKFELPSLHKLIIENVDSLFINTINKHYNEKLSSITREELSQNLINLEYFLIMTKEVSGQLSTAYGKDITLKASSAVKDTRKRTESELFKMVDGKIDDLLDFIDWDWKSRAINKEPNYFMKDIGDFLVNMFNSAFSSLPTAVKTLLLYRVFDILADNFFQELKAQPLITKAAIVNFDLDISYIETITDQLNPTKAGMNGNSSKESLQSMFTELRQVINLMKTGHLDEYRDQSIRNRKYNLVKPEIAISLLNKLEKQENGVAPPSPVIQQGSSASKIFSKFRTTSN